MGAWWDVSDGFFLCFFCFFFGFFCFVSFCCFLLNYCFFAVFLVVFMVCLKVYCVCFNGFYGFLMNSWCGLWFSAGLLVLLSCCGEICGSVKRSRPSTVV